MIASYQITVTPDAEADLSELRDYIANVLRSPETAHSYLHHLRKEIGSLSEMPARYPFFNEEPILPNKYHKMYIEKWYLVLYQIQDDTVYVEYILDCRQDNSGMIM